MFPETQNPGDMKPPGGIRGMFARLLARSVDLELEVDATPDYEIVVVRPRIEGTAVPLDPTRPRSPVGPLMRVRGRYVKLSRRARKLLDSLREYDPRLDDGGFLFPRNQIPSAVTFMKTKQSVKISDRAAPIRVTGQLTPVFDVKEVADDKLQVEAHFETVDPLTSTSISYSPEEAHAYGPDDWLHKGPIFHRGPDTLPEVAGVFAQDSQAKLLADDAVPFFLLRQLKELERSGRVSCDARIRSTRVVEAPFLPKVSLDVEGPWLWIDPKYLAGEHAFSYTSVDSLGPARKYFRHENAWIRIDRQTHGTVRKTLNELGHSVERHGDRFRAPASHVIVIEEALKSLGRIDLSSAFQRFRQRLENFNAIDKVAVPTCLHGKLRAYQEHGLDWLTFLHHYELNGILADDMGLGKTRQTLGLLQYLKERNGGIKALIVCPTSVVDVWLKESTQELSLDLFPFRYMGSGRQKFFDHPAIYNIVVTSYDTVRRDLEELKRIMWDYVILDEAQKIKNPETSTAKACKALLAAHKLALTGTPIENRLGELWSIFDFLMPGYLHSYGRFRDRYEIPIMRRDDSVAKNALKRTISPFKLRRMKADVAKDLPQKIDMDRYCRLTPEQVDLYKRFAHEERARLEHELTGPTVKLTSPHVLAAITRLKQICCHPELVRRAGGTIRNRSGKFEAFVDVLEETLESDGRALIFSQYVEMCSLIKKYLEAESIQYCYLDGGTSAVGRREVVAQYQRDSGPPVFLSSLRAGGLGITLTRANTVIHYDRWWNPAVETQAEDRAHRIGQHETVNVFRIHTEGTIEEKLDRLQKRKRALIDAIIEPDILFKELTRHELLELFTFDPTKA